MLNLESNKVFIGNNEKLQEWNKNSINKIKLLLKNYLELDNVSFLFGAGSSIHLGSISIANIPLQFETDIREIFNKGSETDKGEAHKEFISILKQLQNKKSTDELEKNEELEIKYPIESLLNYLNALQFLSEQNPSFITLTYLQEIITSVKKTLFNICDLDKLDVKQWFSKEENEKLIENKYYFHERLVKKILQRPLNLRRANIFTTNYDLAFENAFDNLGVTYIDGFSGFQNRSFKPETYDYDIYYPGSTTHGKVHRIEKVIKYFKMHGSLTWLRTKPSATNIYGINELPIDLIRKSKGDEEADLFGNIMIYPSATKKAYTLDFPYSELFRQFAATITQTQSVLFTYGYSFSDDHINDIIYQALSIPSFTLIVIDFNGVKNNGIEKLRKLNDPRIIILQGNQLGDFLFFTQYIMPDLIDLNTEKLVAETMQKIFTEPIEQNTDYDQTPTLSPIIEEMGHAIEESSNEDDLPF